MTMMQGLRAIDLILQWMCLKAFIAANKVQQRH